MIEHGISLASNGVVKVPGYEPLLRFGYAKNRSVYRLAVTASGEWEGLAIRCFWHVPDGKDPPSSLVVDGYVDVPASVTAQSGNGCITFEGSDGTKTVTSADLRYRVSANSGTEDGTEPEPGTPAWQQLVDAVHTDATAAEQAKTDAQTAAQQSEASAKAAKTAASEAATSAGSASQSAAKSSAAASNANASAENAARAQVTASQLAGQAADSASEAQNSATKAAASQQAAESNAVAAQGSATKADASASTAVQGQQRAEAAATRAETAQQQTESASTDALDKISSAKTDALKALDTKQTSATTAVESAKGKALDAVTDAQDTATQAVQAEQASATTAVKKAGAEVLTSIPEDYQTTVQKVKELDAQKVETDEAISAVKARQNILIGTETGNPISVDDAFPAPLCGLTVYGRSTQDGTPTPDAPVPIVSAGDDGSVAVKVTGKNLLNSALLNSAFSANGISAKLNSDGSYTISGTPTVDGTIVLWIGGGWNNTATIFTIPPGSYYSNVSIFYYDGKNRTSKKNAFTLLEPFRVTGVMYDKSYTINESYNFLIAPQIEPGSVATTYAPYREQLLTLPTPNGLPGIPVTSGGNYTDPQGQQWVCDEVDLEKGVKVQRVDKAAFDSTKPLTEQNAILATLIETPLTPAEIAAYKALTTYGPDTVVQAGDGAGVKLDYQRDVNLVIKNLEDAIASMTTT